MALSAGVGAGSSRGWARSCAETCRVACHPHRTREPPKMQAFVGCRRRAVWARCSAVNVSQPSQRDCRGARLRMLAQPLSPEYRPGGDSWPNTTPHLTSQDAVACLPRALAPTLGSGCGVLACGTRPPRARWPSLRARCWPQPAGVPGQTRAAALPRPVDRRARGSTAGHSEVQLVFFLLSVTSESDLRQHCLSSRHGGLLSSFLLRT